MHREFKVISNKGGKSQIHSHKVISPDEKNRHFRKILGSVLQEAEDTWGDIWNQFQGSVTEGILISPEAAEGHFLPKCGWSEFLEKIWLLKHYLDYAKRFCDKKA